MTFTKTPPTKPGDYLVKSPLNHVFHTRLEPDGTWTCGPEKWVETKDILDNGGEWCGPLVPVEEVEKGYREGYSDSCRCFASCADADGEIQLHANSDYIDSRARRVVEGEEQV